MAENKHYIAIGEETSRGTQEDSTVGFIPTLGAVIPKSEFDDKKRTEFRGEDSVLGARTVRRMSEKWGASMEIPMFTEAGSVAGMIGTMLKHFFAKVTSTQNAATGQYGHMMYPVNNPYDAGNLGTKALTLNTNLNQGAVMKNWPYIGGRTKSLTFAQEPAQPLKLTVETFGQTRGVVAAEIGSPIYPAENLRLDYNNLKLYTGTITRTGTAPNFTDFTFGSATQIKPDKVTIKLENPIEDKLRLSGVTYPDKTNHAGVVVVTIDITIDWEAPGSGFESVNEFNNWMAGISETNFFCHWDTGTQAGTGDNHSLYLDIPRANRLGGEPEYDLEKDPIVNLKYEGLYDATTAKYIVGLLLKNTAAAV